MGDATFGPGALTMARVAVSYGKLPLSFEANRGQTDPQVKFLSGGRGYTLFLTRSGEAVLVLRRAAPNGDPLRPAALVSAVVGSESEPAGPAAVLRMKLLGGNARPRVEGLDELPGKANYFIGNDPKKWRTDVPTYAKVKFQQIYPGVDLVWYGKQGKLESDFVIAPGVETSGLLLELKGASKLRLNGQGDLVVSARTGELRMEKPSAYQDVNGVRKPVPAGYRLQAKHRVGFVLADYDRSRPVVIDPALVYSTYLGGGGLDLGSGIAIDSAGNAYVSGSTSSTDFPTTLGAFQTTRGGCFAFGCFPTAFVTKLNAAGSALVYSTYLGGNALFVQGGGIAVDSAGNAYVAGFTTGGFPTTPGAFQTTFGGGGDAFVTKLNAAGNALVYSTYLGGPRFDAGGGIAVDSAGNAYVTGFTTGGFPTTPGAFQTTFLSSFFGAFVAKLSADGSSLVYSTYLGANGSGSSIAVDSAGNAYVTGFTTGGFPTTPGAFQTTFGGGTFAAIADAFVTKLSANGSSLVYSSYLGGVGADLGNGIAVDSAGNAYVTGSTTGNFNVVGQVGPGFPTTPGAYQTTFGGGTTASQPFAPTDAFVTKVSADGSSLVYSTFLGGSGNDIGNGIAVDSAGNAYVSGSTSSTNFPTTPGAPQTTFGGGVMFGGTLFGLGDAFVTKLSANGSSLLDSTYLGGSQDDVANAVAVDSASNAYVTGFTGSTNFPTTPGAFQTTFPGGFRHAFVAKLPKGPIDLINDLLKLVQSFNLAHGIANSLDVKLQDALAALQAKDVTTACDKIGDFVSQVQSLSADNMLTAVQAAQLIAAANLIKTALGCP